MKTNLLIICLFVIISCNSHKTEVQTGVTVLNVENLQFKDWASIIQVDSVIQLGINEDSLLSIAQKCVLANDRIIFWDYKLKSVYVYYRQGVFLFTVGKLGGAENECVELRDVTISPDQQSIELLDATGILVFSMQDGHFIEKKNIDGIKMLGCHRFSHTSEDSYLLFSDMEDYSIYKFTNGELEGLRKRNGIQLVSERFYHYDGHCMVLPDYGNYVVDIYRDGTLMPKYHIDFGNQALPEDKLPQTWKQFDKLEHTDDYFKSIVSVIEDDGFLYVRSVGPSRTYYDIYWDKKTGKILSGPADMQLGMMTFASCEGFLYGLVYPEYLSKESPLYPYVQSYVEDEDANPIILKFKFYEK